MGFYTALPGLAPMMDTFRELHHLPLQSQVLPLRSRHTGILTVSESSGDSLSPLITSLADKTSVLPPPFPFSVSLKPGVPLLSVVQTLPGLRLRG